MHLRYPQTAKSRRRRYRFFLLRQNNPYANAETSAWVTRVVAAGSTVSPASATAHDTFITSLKSAGVWSQISRLNTFGASSLAGALVPLVNTSGSPTDTNHNFVSTNFTLATGLTGDQSTKYLDTGVLSPSPDGHLAGLIEGGVGGTAASIGGGDTSWLLTNPNGAALADFYYGANRECKATVATTTIGFFIGTKSSANMAVYRNGISVATSTNGSPQTSVMSTTIFARSSAISTTMAGGPIQEYSIGLAITQAQATSYFNALNTLMSALGRTITP
jgi:hypothetical protein